MLAVILAVWIYQFAYESRVRWCRAAGAGARRAGGAHDRLLGDVLPAPVAQPFIYASSSDRHKPECLSAPTTCGCRSRQWAVAAAILAAVFVFTPVLWERAEPLEPGLDARVPYSLGNDYWMLRPLRPPGVRRGQVPGRRRLGDLGALRGQRPDPVRAPQQAGGHGPLRQPGPRRHPSGRHDGPGRVLRRATSPTARSSCTAICSG